MDIQIDYHSGVPVYKQLVARFETAIQSKELEVGNKLPPIRTLAERLDINPNTVAKVYRELELKGLIESKMGSGCFVLESAETDISAQQKQQFMDQLWNRVIAEAGKYQITEPDLIAFISKRATT